MVSQGRKDFQGLPGSDSGAENTVSLSENKGKILFLNWTNFPAILQQIRIRFTRFCKAVFDIYLG